MLELEEKICAELRRLAHDGIAPSRGRYDQQRNRTLPVSARIPMDVGLSWEEIVARAGLQLSKKARVSINNRQRIPAALDAELSAIQAKNRALDNEKYTDGMTALESSRRVREFYVCERDGTVRRIVQESVSLR